MNAARGVFPQPRWSLPRGRILRRALRIDPTQEYLLYVPASASAHAPVLVSVHGISRNAHEQAAVFSPMCDKRGVIMIAPIFHPEQHGDYQRLGRRGRGMRVDLLLHDHLAEVGRLTGADVSQFFLFGFSGGAQFAHRYVMAHPHRVLRAAIGASGWYTFPDASQRFPYGIRPVRQLDGVNFNPEEFLRVPMEVLIGGQDVTVENLRRTDRCDAQQGTTRLERAQRWVEAMRDAALAYGVRPCTTLSVVPGISHSFSSFCEQGGLVDRVDHALFERDHHESLYVVVPGDATAATGNGSNGNGGNGSSPSSSNGDSSLS